MHFRTVDFRHRIVAGIAGLSLCAGTLSEVSAHLPDAPHQRPKDTVERVFYRLDGQYTVEELQIAFQQRQELVQRETLVHFVSNNNSEELPPVRISISEHPNWVIYNKARNEFTISEQAIRFYLDEANNALFPRVSDAVAYPLENDPSRTRIEGEVRDGYTINVPAAAKTIAAALLNNVETVSVPLTFHTASVHLFTANGLQHLSLLSQGLSDFAKSPAGREANIRRALGTYLNGVLIEENQEFSFNESMAKSFGWHDALVIGEGGKLVSEPGGGICQTASTFFRAVLLAGLPIVERANHSLYVGYYEEYGVGLDATIYPGKQDLIFKNDTDAPVVAIARTDGTKAIIELYGIPDGRTVVLNGPYFSTSNEGYEKKLSIRQIGWQYNVTHPDGRTVQEQIVSTYTMLPKAIRAKYADAQGIRLLSELAPNLIEGQLTMR